jgi:hypothetical protein
MHNSGMQQPYRDVYSTQFKNEVDNKTITGVVVTLPSVFVAS